MPKSNFTPEEWAQISASPMVAGMAITASDPGGFWSILKEAMSSGWAMLEVKQDGTANPLAKAVADDISDPTLRASVRERMQTRFEGSQVRDFKSKAIAELRSVAMLVDTKSPAEAAGFKSWLQGVAQKAAEAGQEGGFLGFGGVAVSEAEKATLDEIAVALGVSPGSAAPTRVS